MSAKTEIVDPIRGTGQRESRSKRERTNGREFVRGRERAGGGPRRERTRGNTNVSLPAGAFESRWRTASSESVLEAKRTLAIGGVHIILVDR